MKEFIVIAHRGGKGPHPENTISAFMHAVKVGFKAIEMDVRYDYLKQRFFLEHDFIHLPKYRQNHFRKLLPEVPRDVTLYLELKTMSCLTNYFTKRLKKIHDEFLIDRDVVYISYNPFVLLRLQKAIPGIKCSFVCGNRFWQFVFEKGLYRILKPYGYLMSKRILRKKNVEFSQKKDIKIFAYVLNKESEWRKAESLGIDGFVSDYLYK